MGITTASLHYHFASKAALGRALVERYTTRFGAALAALARLHPDAPSRLAGYARIYGEVLAADRMCLCGMLAAEYQTLPPAMQRAIRTYFDANEAWLRDVFERGRERGELTFSGAARDAARQWTSTLEGSMLLARPYGDAARLTTVARRMIAELTRAAGSTAKGRLRR